LPGIIFLGFTPSPIALLHEYTARVESASGRLISARGAEAARIRDDVGVAADGGACERGGAAAAAQGVG
jgi:hypothetical protein